MRIETCHSKVRVLHTGLNHSLIQKMDNIQNSLFCRTVTCLPQRTMCRNMHYLQWSVEHHSIGLCPGQSRKDFRVSIVKVSTHVESFLVQRSSNYRCDFPAHGVPYAALNISIRCISAFCGQFADFVFCHRKTTTVNHIYSMFHIVFRLLDIYNFKSQIQHPIVILQNIRRAVHDILMLIHLLLGKRLHNDLRAHSGRISHCNTNDTHVICSSFLLSIE